MKVDPKTKEVTLTEAEYKELLSGKRPFYKKVLDIVQNFIGPAMGGTVIEDSGRIDIEEGISESFEYGIPILRVTIKFLFNKSE